MDIPGNTKLATDPAAPGDEQTVIETRGTGGYAIAPGSHPACHQTGRPYEHYSGPPLTEVQSITAAEREVLLRCARFFDRAAHAAPGRSADGGAGLPGFGTTVVPTCCALCPSSPIESGQITALKILLSLLT